MENRYDETITKLRPLSELDKLEVADDDPDVRGWKVLGADGKTLGTVNELIVDPDQMRVRYLNVDVKEGLTDNDCRLLIPIGMARLDEDHDDVLVPTISDTDVRNYPTYSGGAIDRQHEWEVCNATVADTSSIDDNNFYDQEHFNERQLFTGRSTSRDMSEPTSRAYGSSVDARPVIRQKTP